MFFFLFMNRQLARILVLCYENGFIICYGCIYWGTRYRKSVEPVVSIS